MSNDIAKLPKWAQNEIEILRRDLNSAKNEVNQLREKAFGGSGIVAIEEYEIDGPNTFLPDTASIVFSLGGEWWEKITVRRNGTSVDVMGGADIIVRPEVSNVVSIEIAS
jgi:hypothetical protein